MSQNGYLPQIGVKITNIWNHHQVLFCHLFDLKLMFLRLDFPKFDLDPHLLLGLQCQLQRLFQHLILLLQQGLSSTEIWHQQMGKELLNRLHPGRWTAGTWEYTTGKGKTSEPNHHDFRFYVNLRGCKVLGNFSGCFQIDISEAYQHLDIHLILQKHIWCLSVQ